MKLKLSEEYSIDTDDYTKEGLRIGILGMSGSGKSSTAAVLAEQILDEGGQICVIEPIAEWHTLKAKYRNVVVVGGPFQDLPLEPAFVGEYVETALANGINLVMNLGEMETEEEMRSFVSGFLWSLYRRQQRYRRPLFLFLEEADIWAPQQFDKFSKRCRDRVRTIAKRGRKVGIFPVFITQRPADIDKTPLTQCQVQIFGKFVGAQDLSTSNGVMFMVKKLGVDIAEKDFMNLTTGEFYIYDVNGFNKVHVTQPRQTPHGADTPDIEFEPFEVELAPALEDLQGAIAKAVSEKKSEQNEVDRLGKLVERQTREIEGLEEKLNIKLNIEEVLSGLQGNHRTVVKGVPEKEVERLLEKQGREIRDELQGQIEDLKKRVDAARLALEGENPEPIEEIKKRRPRRRRIKSPSEATGMPWVDIWMPKLSGMEQKIIRFLVDKYPLKLTKSQIALGTGYSARGGSFNRAVSNLVKWRLVEQTGKDYKLSEGPP